LTTVATVMASLGERELDATRDTAVATVVFDPVIDDTSTRLISDVPHIHPTLRVTNVETLVVTMTTNNNKHWSQSLDIQINTGHCY